MAGRFPVNKELALEMAALMAQVRICSGGRRVDAISGLKHGGSADPVVPRRGRPGHLWYGAQLTPHCRHRRTTLDLKSRDVVGVLATFQL